jgi:predicted phage terminase large subunit-like protein
VEDLSGFMLKIDGEEGRDKKAIRPWRVIKIPAILTLEASTILRNGIGEGDSRFEPGTSFWPEFWPTKKLLEIKETTPPAEWAALYMQEPILEEGGIIKRSDFKIWELEKPPQCKYIVVSMDTAFSQKETSDYSAYTVWGVFTNIVTTMDGTQLAQESMILLAADRFRLDFAELCSKCKELDNTYSPEFFIVEDKASGQSLIPELQKRSMPIIPYKPEKDKTFRLQATTPYFQAGRIWVPKGRRWAEEVIEEVTSFNPRLKNQRDDYTDTVSMAVLWMRDQFKIDNDGYSNRWDDEVRTARRRTYWSSVMSDVQVP